MTPMAGSWPSSCSAICPGSTFIVRNMPGAGHLIGANALYASKPDGLTIGSFSTGLIYNQIARNTSAKFDLATMSWIGKAASEPRVILIASHSPVKTFERIHGADDAAEFLSVRASAAPPISK